MRVRSQPAPPIKQMPQNITSAAFVFVQIPCLIFDYYCILRKNLL